MLLELLANILELVLFPCINMGVHMHCLPFHSHLTEIDMILKMCQNHYAKTQYLKEFDQVVEFANVVFSSNCKKWFLQTWWANKTKVLVESFLYDCYREFCIKIVN